MREVMTATNLRKLNLYLAEQENIKILVDDISYQEELFTKLATNDPDVLLILDKLPGPLNKMDLCDEILKLNKSMKLIYILNEPEDITFTRYLKEKGIRDYFDLQNSDIEELLNAILFEDVEKEEVKIVIDQKNAQEQEEKVSNRRQGKIIEVIDSSVIAVISCVPTGKSLLSRVLTNCFWERGYKTTNICLDKENSANIYFNIKKTHQTLLNEAVNKKNFIEIMDNCFQYKDGMKIITGEPYKECNLGGDSFTKLFDVVRSKSDVTIIDCNRKIDNTLKTSIIQSNIVLFIFDLDMINFELNRRFLAQLEGVLIPEKTILVLNNTYPESKSHKEAMAAIDSLNKEFKAVIPVRSCKEAAYDAAIENTTPYELDIGFQEDIDNLLTVVKSRGKIKRPIATKGIFKRAAKLAYNFISSIGKVTENILKNKLIWLLVILAIASYLVVPIILQRFR